MLHRFDSINAVLPASAPQGVDHKHYGDWGQDYMAYVPVIWTFGNLDVNKIYCSPSDVTRTFAPHPFVPPEEEMKTRCNEIFSIQVGGLAT